MGHQQAIKFTGFIWLTVAVISLLYGAASHNDRVMTLTRRLSWERRVRNIWLIAMALLFLVSVSELVVGTGGHISVWRGLALSSVYVGFCLTQRRLFSPASRRAVRSLRHRQLID
jgi:hypothetical protein